MKICTRAVGRAKCLVCFTKASGNHKVDKSPLLRRRLRPSNLYWALFGGYWGTLGPGGPSGLDGSILEGASLDAMRQSSVPHPMLMHSLWLWVREPQKRDGNETPTPLPTESKCPIFGVSASTIHAFLWSLGPKILQIGYSDPLAPDQGLVALPVISLTYRCVTVGA